MTESRLRYYFACWIDSSTQMEAWTKFCHAHRPCRIECLGIFGCGLLFGAYSSPNRSKALQ